MAIPVEHENIGYDSNNKSTFNGNIDSAVSNLKKAEKVTSGLPIFNPRSIIGRKFNKRSVIEQCEKSIESCYNSLYSVQSSVQTKVNKHILADKMVSKALKNASFNITSSINVVKSKIGDPSPDYSRNGSGYTDPNEPRYLWSEPYPGFTPDPITRKALYYLVGFERKQENLIDGCLTYTGPVVSEVFRVFGGSDAGNKIGAGVADFIKTDFAGEHLLNLEKEYNMTRTSADMVAFYLGEDTFDILGSAACAYFGGEDGEKAYSFLSNSGAMAEKIYNSPNIDTNSRTDRTKATIGAASFGGTTLLIDNVSLKYENGIREESLGSGYIGGGTLAISTGGAKSITSEIIYGAATGDYEEVKDTDFLDFVQNQGANYMYRIITSPDNNVIEKFMRIFL